MADLGNPDHLAVIYTASALIGLWVGWFKLVRPKWRRFWAKLDGSLDTLNGRGPITDLATGRVLSPAQPPLGNRIANVEEAVSELREVVKLLTAVQRRLDEHASRISSLEDGRLERIVTKAESAQAWRAVADNAATDTDPA